MSYRASIKIGIIVACLVLLYFRVIQGLVSDWVHMPDFSHGFLIPIVSTFAPFRNKGDDPRKGS